MRYGRSDWVQCALFVSVCGASLVSRQAFGYGTAYMVEYMTSWSGCEAGCSGNNSLSYTDDQMNGLDSAMNYFGNSLRYKYWNANVCASDLVEDHDFLGQDNIYADGPGIAASGYLYGY